MSRIFSFVFLLQISLSTLAAERDDLLLRADALPTAPPELIAGIRHGQNPAHFERWLDLLETSPAQLGSTRLISPATVTAGSTGKLELELRVGQRIDVGGEISFISYGLGASYLQTQNPNAANYLQISNPENARFAQSPIPLQPGVSVDSATFQVDSTPLDTGEMIVFSVSNFRFPKRAGRYQIPIYYSTQAQGEWYVLHQRLTVEPAQFSQISVDVPSRIGRNQEVEATVSLQDRFGNRVDDASASLDVLQDGNFLRQFEMNGATARLSDIRFERPGKHDIEVRTGGGGLRAKSNPIIVQSGNRRIDWIDLHQQSLQTDRPQDKPKPGRTLTQSRWQGSSYWLSLNPVERGGSRLILGGWNAATEWRALPEEVQVALPYSPVDLRAVDSRKLKLVEVVSGGSVFDWYAHRFYRAGLRPGVTATSTNAVASSGVVSGLTGVFRETNESLLSALERGASYVTTGAKMVLHTTVNGAQPGRRIATAKQRSIAGWVQGTAGIERIELLKNGVVIDTMNIAGDPTSQTLKVTVHSSSEPQGNDYPRNGREWIGFLKTTNSSIDQIDAPAFNRSVRQGIAANGSNRVDFITWTQGGRSSFQVTLSDSSEDEVIELNLRAGHEDLELQPNNRAAQPILAARQMVPWTDLEDGAVVRRVKVAGYSDEIRFERINPSPPDFVDFSFTDIEPDATVDFYAIRVHQLDDQSAWTTPVFVGGFDAP